MVTYVLIHGASHGGWCWAKVVPLLQKRGHTVIAPDLPGHGLDKAPIGEQTLQTYVERVCQILDAPPEPVILVGHSMGGRVITQTAEARPDKIRALVYLTAQLLGNGEAGPPPASSADRIPSEDGRSYTYRIETVRDRFYGDCSDGDVVWAKALLCPEARVISTTPMRTSEQNFGRVPRVYIECLQDNAASIARQREMYTTVGVQKVYTLDTSHSPFLSAPVELANILLDIATLQFEA